jgi:aminoglycoside phosphotransferase (APT) family kinase protein
MIDSTPETLKELHKIREAISKEEAGRSSRERTEKTRREADSLLKKWNLSLKPVSPPKAASH